MGLEEPGSGWVAPAKESTPLRPQSPLNRLPSVRDGKLNVSTNVVLAFRMQELKELCFVNFVLAVLTLLYLGLNLVMFVLNAMDRNDDDCGDPEGVHLARCGSPVSDYLFHNMEFWATAAYAMVEAAALVYTPRALSSISNKPNLLKVLLFFDIVATFVPALLVAVNLEAFEVVSHEIEYMNELTMAFVNLVLLASLLRRRDGSLATPPTKDDGTVSVIITCVSAMTAVLQMCIYNSSLPSAETTAHYFEFIFAVLSSFVTFWFCLDNRAIGEEEILCIMYGDHRDCSNCNVVHGTKSLELAMLQQSGSLNAATRARRTAHGSDGTTTCLLV